MTLHLLMTGYVTEKSLTPPSYYSLDSFPTNRLDQLLTTLCSIQDLEFESADFYLDFDTEYVASRAVVENHINELFSKKSIRIFSTRLDSFDSWRAASTLIPLDASSILLKSNLDHAYVASDSKYFNNYLKLFELLDETALGSITHWQEYITESGINHYKILDRDLGLFRKKVKFPIGTILVKRSFFQSWWQEDFTQGSKLVRPDNPFGPSVTFDNEVWQYVYHEELFRHMDGYGHVGLTSRYASAIRACCSLNDGQITHSPWRRGINKPYFGELPLDKSISFTEYFLNLNARYLVPHISWRLRPKKRWSSIKLGGLFFLQLLTNNDFQKSFLRTILQKYGRSRNWKYNLLNYYSALTIRLPFLPAYSKLTRRRKN